MCTFQVGPPRRLLRYKPDTLHAYGWIPGFPLRNFRATVFYDPFLVVQVCVQRAPRRTACAHAMLRRAGEDACGRLCSVG